MKKGNPQYRNEHEIHTWKQIVSQRRDAETTRQRLSQSRSNNWDHSSSIDCWFNMRLSKITIAKLVLASIGMTLIGLYLFLPAM